MSGSLLVTLGVVGGGVALAWLWLPARRQLHTRLAQAVAWGPGLGFGLLSLCTFFSLSVGLGRIGAWVAAAAMGSAAWVAARRWREAGPRGAALAETSSRSRRWAAGACLFLTILVLGFALARWTEQRPHGTGDAVNIWVVRSLFLYRAPGDLPDLFSEMVKGHPDYPLALPAALAGQYQLAGSENLVISQATGLFFLVGLGFMIYAAVERLGSRVLALATTSFVLGTPIISRWAFCQVADVPLAYHALGAVTGLALLLERPKEPPVPPIMVGLFVGLLPWTKNEGIALAAACGLTFAVALVLMGRLRRDGFRLLSRILLGALPGLLATALYKLSWISVSETERFLSNPLDKALDPSRWSAVMEATWSQLSPATGHALWATAWPFLALGFLMTVASAKAGYSSSGLRFMAASVAASLGAYFMAYLLSPYELGWHLDRSLDRVLLQVFPIAAVLAFSAVARLGSARSRRQSDLI